MIALVDTLRADHMSCYGYHRTTTPEIDAFSEQAMLFERARSQASCTYPSVNSLLTSRYPAHFLFQPNGYMGIPEGTASIAEVLLDHGYQTAGISASPIVRSSPSKENPDGGYGRGFQVFDESCLFQGAACVNSVAKRWIERTSRPFFLYLHFMDPHDPYRPPPSQELRFARTHQGPDFIRDGNPNPIADMVYDGGPQVAVTDQDIQHLVDLYDDEIRFFDGQFSAFLDVLRGLDVYENTIVVLSSDHGEEFMEHGDHIKHCHVLYDTSTRVPLIMRIPGLSGPRRIVTAVQNLDIVPTLLDYLGIAKEDTRMNGTSMRSLIEGAELQRWIAFSNQGKWRSADDGHFKLLLDAASVQPQLFDLENDPLEQTDLYRFEHPTSLGLERDLYRFLNMTEGGVGTREALAAGEETENRLRALGYLQ